MQTDGRDISLLLSLPHENRLDVYVRYEYNYLAAAHWTVFLHYMAQPPPSTSLILETNTYV